MTTPAPRSATVEPTLVVDDLSIAIADGTRQAPAVSGVSFTIPAGKSLGLVGESGCGKSLTALAVMRLVDGGRVRTSGGGIFLMGEDLITVSEARMCQLRGNQMAMIFQDPAAALNPVMRVGQQVAEPLRRHKGMTARAAAARAVALLNAVGIPDADARARGYPHEFSGGMKQRVLTAMALACDPALLIADEPTTALDVTVQAQILDLLNRKRHERRMAMLFISHDLAVVSQTCDDIAVMYAGVIVEHATATGLISHPRHPYTAGLLDALGSMAPDESGQGATPGPKRRRRLREIPGSVPTAGAQGTGCAFVERCGHATAICRSHTPSLAPVAAGHLVRCHHPLTLTGGPTAAVSPHSHGTSEKTA